MAKQIHVERFYIFSGGDESVGLWDQEWTVGPDFYFENENELKEFKEKLKEAFEYICENPEITTQAEIDEYIKQFEGSKDAFDDENFVDEPMSEEELNEQIKKDWSLEK